MAAINLGNDPNAWIGTSADEHVNGQGGDDVIHGGAGNDVLNGGVDNDKLFGDAGDDHLQGAAGDDTLTGGAGNDLLDTASGEDVIAFHFDLISGAGQTRTFTLPLNPTQSQLSNQYGDFLRTFGSDLNNDGKISVELGQNGGKPTVEGAPGLVFGGQKDITVITGKVTQVRTIYTEVTTAGQDQLTSPDGHDTAASFTWGTDKIDFGDLDLTLQQFDTFFDVAFIDADNDLAFDDTVLKLADGTWSVTLLNVSGHTIGDFYTAIFG